MVYIQSKKDYKIDLYHMYDWNSVYLYENTHILKTPLCICIYVDDELLVKGLGG